MRLKLTRHCKSTILQYKIKINEKIALQSGLLKDSLHPLTPIPNFLFRIQPPPGSQALLLTEQETDLGTFEKLRVQKYFSLLTIRHVTEHTTWKHFLQVFSEEVPGTKNVQDKISTATYKFFNIILHPGRIKVSFKEQRWVIIVSSWSVASQLTCHGLTVKWLKK